MGICTSTGVIRDFAGPYFVSVSNSCCNDVCALLSASKQYEVMKMKSNFFSTLVPETFTFSSVQTHCCISDAVIYNHLKIIIKKSNNKLNKLHLFAYSPPKKYQLLVGWVWPRRCNWPKHKQSTHSALYALSQRLLFRPKQTCLTRVSSLTDRQTIYSILLFLPPEAIWSNCTLKLYFKTLFLVQRLAKHADEDLWVSAAVGAFDLASKLRGE